MSASLLIPSAHVVSDGGRNHIRVTVERELLKVRDVESDNIILVLDGEEAGQLASFIQYLIKEKKLV